MFDLEISAEIFGSEQEALEPEKKNVRVKRAAYRKRTYRNNALITASPSF